MLSLHEVLQVLRNTVKFETYHYSIKFPGLSGTKSFSRTFQSFGATTTTTTVTAITQDSLF